MLANSDKENRNVGRVDKTDQGPNHVAHCVTLGNNEAIQGSNGAKCSIEVSSLSDGVSTNEGLLTNS